MKIPVSILIKQIKKTINFYFNFKWNRKSWYSSYSWYFSSRIAASLTKARIGMFASILLLKTIKEEVINVKIKFLFLREM